MTTTQSGNSTAAQSQQDQINDDNLNFSNLTILLVEDDKESRELTRKILISFGITDIYDAKTGYEALSFLETSYDMVDIILCDWVMPGMDGYDLLAKIRAIDTNIPFLMVTGLNDIDSVTAARNAGVTSYITKPIKMHKLKKTLTVLARQKKLEQSQIIKT